MIKRAEEQGIISPEHTTLVCLSCPCSPCSVVSITITICNVYLHTWRAQVQCGQGRRRA